MSRLWLRQLAAVFRLEIRKSFLSRRGLWIYLLAAIPILIFAGHAWDVSRKTENALRNGDPAVSLEKARQIHEGMSEQDVLTLLPVPHGTYTFRRGERKDFTFQGREVFLQVRLRDGIVSSVLVTTGCDFTEDTLIFAGVFQFFYLRLAIFFGCVFVFLNLFRGEMLSRSLHYYFLAPVRREIVVVGKYLAGVAATSVVFAGSTAIQLWIFYRHFNAAVLDQYLAQGNGWSHAASYLGVTVLACIGYGSIFLLAGIVIRNPLIPAAVMLFWESINGLLPLALRRLSVIYYLRSLCPIDIPIGQDVPPPLALLAMHVEPASVGVAILGLLLLSAAFLALAAWKSRSLQIHYVTD